MVFSRRLRFMFSDNSYKDVRSGVTAFKIVASVSVVPLNKLKIRYQINGTILDVESHSKR